MIDEVSLVGGVRGGGGWGGASGKHAGGAVKDFSEPSLQQLAGGGVSGEQEPPQRFSSDVSGINGFAKEAEPTEEESAGERGKRQERTLILRISRMVASNSSVLL